MGDYQKQDLGVREIQLRVNERLRPDSSPCQKPKKNTKLALKVKTLAFIVDQILIKSQLAD